MSEFANKRTRGAFIAAVFSMQGLGILVVEDSRSIPLPSSTYPLFSKQFLHRHGSHLFGCAATWFLLDVVYYTNNFFQSQISDPRCGNDHFNAFDDAFHMAKLQAIIAICSTIPGYWATVCLIERIGRVKIQIMGFLFMAAGMFAIGGLYSRPRL
ncbi:phosphate transporter [Ancistrocladus abbreviatus]